MVVEAAVAVEATHRVPCHSSSTAAEAKVAPVATHKLPTVRRKPTRILPTPRFKNSRHQVGRARRRLTMASAPTSRDGRTGAVLAAATPIS